jgi:adenylate kinase family enzyme
VDLVLLLNQASLTGHVHTNRILAVVLGGQEADDEAMFEKRYEEYVQENEEIARQYRERGLLVAVDTGKGTEELWEKLYDRLEKDIKWTDIIGERVQDREGNSPQTGA